MRSIRIDALTAGDGTLAIPAYWLHTDRKEDSSQSKMNFDPRSLTQGLLRKINTQTRSARLKSSECWRIFYCFFRACVALAYPDHWSQGLNLEIQEIPVKEEIIPRDLPLRLFDGSSANPPLLPPRSTQRGIIDLFVVFLPPIEMNSDFQKF